MNAPRKRFDWCDVILAAGAGIILGLAIGCAPHQVTTARVEPPPPPPISARTAVTLGTAHLGWTFPKWQPSADGCTPDSSKGRENDPRCWTMYARPDTPGSSWECAWYGSWGKAGEAAKISVPLVGPTWFRLTTTDAAGNESCPGNEILRVP